MANQLPALIFGGILLLIGGIMLLTQRRALRDLDALAENDADRLYLIKRTRRRTQVAGLILLMGVMIPVGDSLVPWQKAPATFALFCIIILALAFWTILLAIGDIVATRNHLNQELNQLKRHQVELERVAEKLRDLQAGRSSEK